MADAARQHEQYERLVATLPEVERKGATMPYTSRNGHMFSFVTKTGEVALRLPAGVREAFMEQYGACPCEQNGTVLKEYVVVPDDLLERTEELAEYFRQSYAYVGSLKPKPTSKKKASGAG